MSDSDRCIPCPHCGVMNDDDQPSCYSCHKALGPAAALPPGDYCIVEFFGHTTMVGRYAEVERFGTKMLALEPLFRGKLLPVIFHGGSSIYRLTPCSAAVAFERGPEHDYQLPTAVRCIVPPAMLPAPSTVDHEEDDAALGDDPAFNDEAE